MTLGYARVSTDEQSLEVQVKELKSAGCKLVFTEKLSGKTAQRPVLEKLMGFLEQKCPQCHGFDDYCADVAPCETCAATGRRYPDVLVVTKLDRLARSTSDLLAIVERIGRAGASFVSLAEPWADTTSPAGKLIMTVFAGVAQFERERMLERCDAGRAVAKQNGVRFGRRPKLTAHQEREIGTRLDAGENVRTLAQSYRVNRATIYRVRQKGRAE